MSDSAQWTQRHATELRNHWWWRPGWHVGTRFYAWHITFDDAPELYRLTNFWQDRLRSFDYLDTIPRQWLHMTMQGVGMVEDVPNDQRDQLVVSVRQRLAELPATPVQFQRVVVSSEAVVMHAQPARTVEDIRSAVRVGMADALGTDAVPGSADDFVPHVSVAYVNRKQDASDIVGATESADPPPVAEVDLTHASLIEMHRDNRMYEWRTIANARMRNG